PRRASHAAGRGASPIRRVAGGGTGPAGRPRMRLILRWDHDDAVAPPQVADLHPATRGIERRALRLGDDVAPPTRQPAHRLPPAAAPPPAARRRARARAGARPPADSRRPSWRGTARAGWSRSGAAVPPPPLVKAGSRSTRASRSRLVAGP